MERWVGPDFSLALPEIGPDLLCFWRHEIQLGVEPVIEDVAGQYGVEILEQWAPHVTLAAGRIPRDMTAIDAVANHLVDEGVGRPGCVGK